MTPSVSRAWVARLLGVAAIAGSAAAFDAAAFTIVIAPGPRAVFLQVGDGAFSGTYLTGGTPGTSATVNTVSVTVPAASLGNGVSQAMTTDSHQTTSLYSGLVQCSVPQQVYVGGFYRRPGAGVGTDGAVLSVSTPTTLTSAAGDTIPFSQIAWVSGANDGSGQESIPNGSFSAPSLTLRTFSANTWSETCLAFSYANATFAPAGTYSGRATYTLSAP